MKTFQDFLEETFMIKVNAHGDKTRRLKCPDGYKLNETGTACVPIASSEKQTAKIASRQAVRTKKAEGAGLKRKALVKTRRALKFRKRYGL